MASSSKAEFPPIVPGGSLMVAWQTRGKHILIVGGGEVAAGRIVHALNADAFVTVVAPKSGLNPEVAYRVLSQQVRHVDREFEDQDLDLLYPLEEGLKITELTAEGNNTETHADRNQEVKEGHHQSIPVHRSLKSEIPVSMVLTAIDSPDASTHIYKLCHARRIPVNVADVPPECDFYFGSIYRDGPVQVMVSTNGKGPKMANLIRRKVEECLTTTTTTTAQDGESGEQREVTVGLGKAVERVGEIRKRLRELAPNIEDGRKRMKWMTSVSEAFSFAELANLSDAEIDRLLGYYQKGQVPTISELRQKQ